ncbi:hypothetical protein [Anaeromicropila populeti]|uniref:Uncharacterized protein n=1 Tax=Anaeromicropila populeti TaxID=37658 RepID=A0A1I6HP34_9FIRM|nr:hypothetical protein [Anaeromicropila populeti]SFR56209.1 hypothetical protein SAMN05661086_00138 [Anaeromicropila populeti]
MNYACMTNKAFVSRGKVVTHKKMSEEFKARRQFFNNHSFTVNANPSDTSCTIEVHKIEES